MHCGDKVGVRIEMASQLHLQRRVSICAASAYEPEGRERGGEFHHRTLHRNAILARERLGKGRGDKVMLIQCQHCIGKGVPKGPKDTIDLKSHHISDTKIWTEAGTEGNNFADVACGRSRRRTEGVCRVDLPCHFTPRAEWGEPIDRLGREGGR